MNAQHDLDRPHAQLGATRAFDMVVHSRLRRRARVGAAAHCNRRARPPDGCTDRGARVGHDRLRSGRYRARGDQYALVKRAEARQLCAGWRGMGFRRGSGRSCLTSSSRSPSSPDRARTAGPSHRCRESALSRVVLTFQRAHSRHPCQGRMRGAGHGAILPWPRPRGTHGYSWLMRTRLPDGSRNAQSRTP